MSIRLHQDFQLLGVNGGTCLRAAAIAGGLERRGGVVLLHRRRDVGDLGRRRVHTYEKTWHVTWSQWAWENMGDTDCIVRASFLRGSLVSVQSTGLSF